MIPELLKVKTIPQRAGVVGLVYRESLIANDVDPYIKLPGKLRAPHRARSHSPASCQGSGCGPG